MRKQTIVADSTLVGQIPEGKSCEVVVDEKGRIFIPLLTIAALAGGAGAAASNGGSVAAKEETTAAPAKRGRGGKAAAETAPAEKSSGGVSRDALKKVFAGFDSGDLEPDAAEKELKALVGGDKAKTEALVAVLDAFVDDQDLTVDAVTDMAVKALNGESVEDAGAASAEGEVVDVKDLKVGDRVSVTFEETETYDPGDYQGTVKSIGRRVMIHFDDDAEAIAFDKEIMTEIVRLPAVEEKKAPAKRRGKK